MDITYRLQGVEFEWDEDKAVAFEEGAEAFFDPFYQEGDASIEGEQRDFIIGYSLSQCLPLIIYAERGERMRIISARPVTCQERKLYEES